MAEKEERIAVAKMIVNTDDEGSAKLDHFKIYSRREAINRIAKAIKSVPKASGEAVHSTYYAKWAEAALNALLGESND